MKHLIPTNVNRHAAKLFCGMGLAILSSGATHKQNYTSVCGYHTRAATTSNISEDRPLIKAEIAEFSISGRGLSGSDEKKS